MSVAASTKPEITSTSMNGFGNWFRNRCNNAGLLCSALTDCGKPALRQIYPLEKNLIFQ
jgi:hypothetical protein